jgi:hypothetical protein
LNRDDSLRGSLKCGVRVQELLVSEALSIISRKQISSSEAFRNVVLESGNDLHFLSHPIVLCQLTTILFQCEYQQKGNKRPMLVAVLSPHTNSYILNGITDLPISEKHRNKFPLAFERAAQKTNTRILRHFTHPSCIEIQKDDFFKFHDFLHHPQ